MGTDNLENGEDLEIKCPLCGNNHIYLIKIYYKGERLESDTNEVIYMLYKMGSILHKKNHEYSYTQELRFFCPDKNEDFKISITSTTDKPVRLITNVGLKNS